MRKKQTNKLLIKKINLFAFSTAAFLAIGLPGIYFLDDYFAEVQEVNNLAAKQASAMNMAISEHPEIWPNLMQQLMSEMPISGLDDDEDETIAVILDMDKKLIASSSHEARLEPAIIKEAVLFNDAKPIGLYRVERSYNDLLIETLFVACGGLFLALIVVVPLRKLPLGSLHTALNALEEEKEKALITLESIRDAVITTDASLRVEYLSPAAERMTGWSTEQVQGWPLGKVFKISDPVPHEADSASAVAGSDKDPQGDITKHGRIIRQGDNREFHIEFSSAPIGRADGETIGVVIVFHDVTTRHAHHNHLRDMAFHDELTKLPNRTLFQEKLAMAMEDARSRQKYAGVFYMDLDRFKFINDSFGHDIGDELLVSVSKRLRRCVRSGDTVSRIGGDEFAAVLQNMNSPEDAQHVAEKIIRELSYPFSIQNEKLQISVSIGIAVCPGDGDSIDALLKNADTAMYLAKSFGRNNFKYFSASASTRTLEQADSRAA